MIRNSILFLLFTALLGFQACLDNNLDFPDDIGEDAEVTQSIAIVSLFNALETQFLRPENACLRFVYPIDLGFNNGITITIENETGLLEAVRSQSSGLHVNSISFPFLMTNEDRILSIENEQDLIAALGLCFIPTLRHAIDEVHKQCFDLVYPVTMLSSSGDEVLIENKDDYFILYDEEGPDYQPVFKFPIELKVFSKGEKVTITNYYDLYQQMNKCGGCPEVGFEYTVIEDFQYRFTASLSDFTTKFDWYINGSKVQSGDPTHGSILDTLLLPGTYDVCLKGYSEDCVIGELYCESIFVEERCPMLHFEPFQNEQNPNLYDFGAFFEGRDLLESYKWYINGEFFEEELPGSDDSLKNVLIETPGVYTVCIKTTTDFCPGGTEYCESVAFGCIPLDFVIQEESTWFEFIADFEGKELITYIWSIYVNDVKVVEDEVRFPGSGDDHKYVFEKSLMEPGVIYEVCIKQDGPCLEQVMCKQFSIQ